MSFLHLDAEDIRYLHDEALEEYGGFSGEHEPGMIEFMARKPFEIVFGHDRYPDIFSKAAVYLEGFATHQYFADGNKRTALKCCLVFLDINGYNLNADEIDLFKFVKKVVEEKLDIDTIADWLEKHSMRNLSYI